MSLLLFFFFNDTATTEIYTLSLHDALPISTMFADLSEHVPRRYTENIQAYGLYLKGRYAWNKRTRSEEHTSELQSRLHLVCRLLLEKKKNIVIKSTVGHS